MERCIYFVIGFCLVFIGAAYHRTASRRIGRTDLTDFQSFLFGTGFAYFMITAWELLEFFCDYYIPGSALQGYNTVPDQRSLFFVIFGRGVAGEAQFPVVDLNLDMLSCMCGCALGGAALLARLAILNRKRHTPQNGLLYGFPFRRLSLKAYLANERRVCRQQVAPVEYLAWWILRAAMVFVLVRRIVSQGFDTVTLQLTANFAVTFIIPLVRVLFFRKLFFGRIHFRVQTYIDIFILFGSFLGQGCGFMGSVPEYDKFLHLLCGIVTVLIAWRLIEGTRGGRSLPGFTKTVAAVGFSHTVMVVWEIFEFMADFYVQGCCNQNWGYNPSPDLLFFRVFGFGARNPGQFAVLDTNLDILIAVCGCALCSAVLFVILRIRETEAQKRTAARNKRRLAEVRL